MKFSGNKTFSKTALFDNMVFQQSSFITRVLQRQEPSLYSHELMEVDIERLMRFYQSEGFLHVTVELDSLNVNNKKHTVDIHIAIVENAPVLVDSIRISMADSLENIRNQERFMRNLYKSLSLKNGERFVDSNIYNDVGRISNQLNDWGYVYSTTDFTLRLRPDENAVYVDYRITPGGVCQFGKTFISGNRYVKEKHIRRQLNYQEGDRYSLTKIDRTRQQLYDLQLFRVVAISPQTDRATQQNPIALQYQIQEMPRWMSKFGVGWGTEDRFRTFADVTYRSLWGGTSRVNFYVKHSALEPYHFSVSWIEPQFYLKKLSLAVNPYLKRESEPAYDIQRFGLNVSVGYAFNNKIRSSVAYYLERVKQFDAPNEDPAAGYLNPESSEYLYNKSGLSASVAYSNAAPMISPERGASVTLGGKINGYIFGSDFNYTKLWLDARKYQRVGSFVFAGRAMIGGIRSSDDGEFIPVEDRFYSGGSNSNRGWKRHMLGPVTETIEGGKTNTSPEGGKSILEMNLEIRHPLAWKVELAAFTDFGNVWKEAYHYRFDNLYCAVGGGVRVSTPIGPVRLDVGVPVVGTADRKVQFFLSVGQAF